MLRRLSAIRRAVVESESDIVAHQVIAEYAQLFADRSIDGHPSSIDKHWRIGDATKYYQ